MNLRGFAGGFFCVCIALALADCGGGGGSPSPRPTATPTVTPTATTAGSSSVTATVGGTSSSTVTVPTIDGYAVSVVFPAGSLPSNTVATLTNGQSPPEGLPALDTRSRTLSSNPPSPLDFVGLEFGSSFNVSDFPGFSFTSSQALIASDLYYLALYTPSTGWIDAFDGPATVSGSTLTFTPEQLATPLAIQANTQYAVALYAVVPSATPSPSATPTGAAPTPTPTPTSTAVALTCSLPTAVLPGNYFSLITSGSTSGSTYTADLSLSEANAWEYGSFSAAASPAPTSLPSASPTSSPTSTPTPTMSTIYSGTYSVASFSGSAIPQGGSTPAAYSVPAQSGCFLLVIVQPVGGVAGQGRQARIAAASSDNTSGDAFPNLEGQSYSESTIASGAVTQLQILNLSAFAQTGNGTFTLDTGATGTISIQSATTSLGVLRSAQKALDTRK